MPLFLGSFNTYSAKMHSFLRDDTPINICFSQFTQPIPQQRITFRLAYRILSNHLLSLVTSHLHQLPIASNIRNFQVESHSTLCRSFQVTWATQLQVGFSNTEAIISLTHNINAFASVFTQLVRGDKDAEGLVGSSPHPTTQLMQLRQAKTLGIENHHHRGIGYVDTHFYYCCCHQYLGISSDKTTHLFFFL